MLVTGKNFRANNGLRVTIGPVEPSDDTPSASLRSAAPSEREPGEAVPFTPPPKNRNVAGDFHRPYETQRF